MNPSAVKCESYLPGPQKRGTGGTLRLFGSEIKTGTGGTLNVVGIKDQDQEPASPRAFRSWSRFQLSFGQGAKGSPATKIIVLWLNLRICICIRSTRCWTGLAT